MKKYINNSYSMHVNIFSSIIHASPERDPIRGSSRARAGGNTAGTFLVVRRTRRTVNMNYDTYELIR